MKATTPAAESSSEKRGHICPPSDAKHPRDRWETLFVYSFICKFTQLRGKVEGLDSPMDLEDAVLVPEANPVMTQILAKFVQNLRPQTRNLSSDVISSTVAAIFQEFSKMSERNVFWDEDLKTNVEPFSSTGLDFWKMDWDTKLKVLRQLVELQLCHGIEIKAIIDRAWGVIHNKHKKHEMTPAPPPPSDPFSQENLLFNPIGQDIQRRRFWIVDDSPRVYMSTNPWKVTSAFQSVASTQEEYLAWLEDLKKAAPGEGKPGERRAKMEVNHLALIKLAEERIPAIEAELARIQRAKKKIAQRNMLIAQAEVRETRTRSKTARPNYAYLNDPEVEDDNDDYQYDDRGDEDDQFIDDEEEFSNGQSDGWSARGSAPATRRRSTRASTSNNGRNGDKNKDEWRGERRSSRLGAPSDYQLDAPPPKRARTEDSATSSVDTAPATTAGGNGIKIKVNGAAAPKPTETIVETVAGKKKSRFWVYAVEPIAPKPGTVQHPPNLDVDMVDAAGPSTVNGHYNGTSSATDDAGRASSAEVRTNGDIYEKSIEGSLSPASSMDES